LSFQRVENYVAPTWPDGNTPKQMHLDFEVDDLDEENVTSLASVLEKPITNPGRPSECSWTL